MLKCQHYTFNAFVSIHMISLVSGIDLIVYANFYLVS